MTDEQIKAALLEWAEAYCNTEFGEEPPGGVELFLEKAVAYFNANEGLSSESLGDYSVSYENRIPPSLLALIEPYRVKTVKFL